MARKKFTHIRILFLALLKLFVQPILRLTNESITPGYMHGKLLGPVQYYLLNTLTTPFGTIIAKNNALAPSLPQKWVKLRVALVDGAYTGPWPCCISGWLPPFYWSTLHGVLPNESNLSWCVSALFRGVPALPISGYSLVCSLVEGHPDFEIFRWLRMKSDGVEWIQTEWHTDRKVRIRIKVWVTIFRIITS